VPPDKRRTPRVHVVLPCIAIALVALGTVAATVGGEREPGYLMLGMGVGVLLANGVTAYTYARADRRNPS